MGNKLNVPPAENDATEISISNTQLSTFGFLARKIFAGRFILTVGTAYGFIVLIHCLSKILMERSADIDVDKILLMMGTFAIIIQNVFQTYFYKNAIQSNNVNNKGEPDDLVNPPVD